MVMALLIACGAAQASEWVPLPIVSDGRSQEFIDLSSIRVTAHIRRAWVKSTFPHGTFKDALGKGVAEIVASYEFNCSEGTSRRTAGNFHYEDGTDYVDTTTVQTTWRPVEPDTLGEARMKFACAWKPK